MAIGIVAAPFARGSILWFLGGSEGDFRGGLAGAAFRLGLVVAGVGILAGHEVVIRGRDRAVLDPHPVDPGELIPVLRLRLLRVATGTALGVMALLWPVLADGHALGFGLASAVVLQAALLGAAVGSTSQLGAAWAAFNPHLSQVLEAIRGSNPRMQAALIYAPGVAVGIVAAALFLALRGIEAGLAGHPLAFLLVAAPTGVALPAWFVAPALARSWWYPASTLLGEVDAAWEARTDPEAARRVYLEWVVRFVPSSFRPLLLLRLRQGWRGLRGWITGAWALGAVAGMAGWSARPEAPRYAALVAGAGICLVGAVAIRMVETHPEWLDGAIPTRRLVADGARFVATLCWLQGVLVPPVLAVLVRQPGHALPLLFALEALAGTCALVATLAGPLRARGYLAYAPIAALAWLAAGGLA